MPNNKERVCIIGGGPAGLSSAMYLEKKGYTNYTIYEKLKKVKGKIIFKYHNITPPEFFESYNLKLFRLCKKGRAQTLQYIKDFPDAY